MRRQAKNDIYLNISIITKALSSPKRIEIIDLLSQGEKIVEVIAEQANLGIKNASAQLKELKSSRLLESRKVGKNVYYYLANENVAKFLIELRSFSQERIVELQKVLLKEFSSSADLIEVNRKNLLAKAKRGDVVIIDVRPMDEFEQGHIPYALSVPISEISKHIKNFPKSKEIVAYCRGPYCFFAKDAVEYLRSKGFKANRLSDSVQEWKSYGLPIEVPH